MERRLTLRRRFLFMVGALSLLVGKDPEYTNADEQSCALLFYTASRPGEKRDGEILVPQAGA